MPYIFMGKFDRIPLVTGTFDEICIYKMHGRYFFRSRSSLTGERVKADPAFRKTMYFASLMGKASRIGSTVYASLPIEGKNCVLYRKITGEAMTWLKYGWTEADVLQWLQQRYTPQQAIVFCKQHQEQLELQEQSATEEHIYARFMARNNRWRLRKLRQGDIAWLDEIDDDDDEYDDDQYDEDEEDEEDDT
jgi:hypothetical protein